MADGHFEIDGPPSFIAAVKRFEQEISGLPQSMLGSFTKKIPVLRFSPESLRADHPYGAIARADGIFAIDGTDYDFFRWALLHELGHHFAASIVGWAKESKANEFAAEILTRIENLHLSA